MSKSFKIEIKRRLEGCFSASRDVTNEASMLEDFFTDSNSIISVLILSNASGAKTRPFSIIYFLHFWRRGFFAAGKFEPERFLDLRRGVKITFSRSSLVVEITLLSTPTKINDKLPTEYLNKMKIARYVFWNHF